MRVVLISPRETLRIPGSLPEYVSEEAGLYPPLGIAYIAATIEKYSRVDVSIIDMNAENLSYQDLKYRIERINPDVVGISATSFTLLDAILCAKNIKSINKDIHICMGGPHPSIYPYQTVRLECIDSVIVGEGEMSFLQLVKNLSSKERLSNVAGIVYKDKDGNIVINNVTPAYIEDLDSLPPPARHLLPYKKYYTLLGTKYLMTTMITTRGCPYNCIFCYKMFKRAYRKHSASYVINELKNCLDLGIRYFFIFDDLFTLDRRRTEEIVDRILQEDLRINFSVRSRIDTIDEDILYRLREAGCQRISFGIESADDKVLSALRKGIDLKKAEIIFKTAKELGIETYADFMIGSPLDTKETIQKTIEFALKLDPDYAQFSITTPLPDTDLYKLGLSMNLYRDYWSEFAQNPSLDFMPKFWEENLSREELLYLLNYAYRRFYIRYSYILKRLLNIKSCADFLRKARAAAKLAIAWKKKIRY